MAEYSEIELTGLSGSNPLGAMAAFGLLRICTTMHEVDTPRLLWRMSDDWIAVLNVKNDLTADGLLSLIETYLEQRKKGFYTIDEIKMKPEEFRTMAVKHVESASAGKRVDADYWAAFGSEMVVDRTQGRVKPTEFHMVSGQQGFLNKIRKTLNAIKRENIREALFGPWEYNDTHEFAMGWDPTTGRIHALRNVEPSKDKSPLCVSAAEWLGFESLPLFPTAVSAGKLLTTGFSGNEFVWAVWEKPIALDTLRTILGSAELSAENRNSQKLRVRGISAVYSSARLGFGKGYGIFTPARMR
jgi:hypothetical protein